MGVNMLNTIKKAMIVLVLCGQFMQVWGRDGEFFNPIKDMERFINDKPYKDRISHFKRDNEIQATLQEIIKSSSLQTLEYIARGKNKVYPYSIKDEYQYAEYVYNWLLYLIKYNQQFLNQHFNICNAYQAFYLDLEYNYPIVAIRAIMAYIGNDYRQDKQYKITLQQDKILSNLYILFFDNVKSVVHKIGENHCLVSKVER